MKLSALVLLFTVACSFTSGADISVLDYGACGDAVVDNTHAFQTANP